MASKISTPQEQFWAGEFGDEYIGRNAEGVSRNLSFFASCLRQAEPIDSCVELGANIGLNMQALRLLYPSAYLAGVEINAKAAQELRHHAHSVSECSILDWEPPQQFDLALIKTVLIHIHPERLSEVYSRLYRASKRYILIAEYFNPTPVEVPYRGHSERLFKRDFAGEMLDAYPDLKLLDYGFRYDRDAFPQDNVTWFLMEKSVAWSSPKPQTGIGS